MSQVLRWLLWLAGLGLLVAWILTWALDAPERPSLAEPQVIGTALVQVSGTACGRFSEGNGFAVEPNLVLTNAHVVAGVEHITVTTPDDLSTPGTLVGYDSGRDIAAISVPAWAMSTLQLAPGVADADDMGDVVTTEPGEGLERMAFQVNRRVWATGNDFYGEPADDRIVLEVTSELAPGDSGAALLNPDGEVWAMVFGTVRGQSDMGYALDRVEIADFTEEIDRNPQPTPPCRTR